MYRVSYANKTNAQTKQSRDRLGFRSTSVFPGFHIVYTKRKTWKNHVTKWTFSLCDFLSLFRSANWRRPCVRLLWYGGWWVKICIRNSIYGSHTSNALYSITAYKECEAYLRMQLRHGDPSAFFTLPWQECVH